MLFVLVQYENAMYLFSFDYPFRSSRQRKLVALRGVIYSNLNSPRYSRL